MPFMVAYMKVAVAGGLFADDWQHDSYIYGGYSSHLCLMNLLPAISPCFTALINPERKKYCLPTVDAARNIHSVTHTHCTVFWWTWNVEELWQIWQLCVIIAPFTLCSLLWHQLTHFVTICNFRCFFFYPFLFFFFYNVSQKEKEVYCNTPRLTAVLE